jgi:hypothetical protein
MENTHLPVLVDPATALRTEVAALARRYAKANGPVIALVTKLGGGLEKQLVAFPASLQKRIGQLTETALATGWAMANARGVPDPGRKGSLAAAMASGVVGGAGGLAASVTELPVTITLILHAIRREAVLAGFDPDDPHIRAECLKVFAAGSPLAGDDGINTSFVSSRLTLTGPALQKLIATVAPKLATVMTQKLAAQAVPILGAVTGATLNASFLIWYREIAAIRFALLRLATTHGEEPVLAAFRQATSRSPSTR